jgi:glycosyltransferase involved in cell wall biosynthesis
VTIPSAGYIEESRVLTNPDVDVTRLRNGVPVDKFDLDLSQEDAKTELGLDPDEFVIVYMGALHQRKGPDVLVEAFEQIHDDVGDTTLIMAGSGELTDSLRAEAERLGVANAVSFPGFVPEAEKPTYLTAADVFVLPSTTGGAEMFPLAILEAAAAGTPVVTSDFPTLRPIIEEYEIGCLVQPGEADDLAKVITDICDEETLKEYSANALRMARDHSWDEIADEYLSLYEDIIAEDSKTGPQQPL